MASRALPNLGLMGFWDIGTPYKDENDANLRLISAVLQGRVLGRVAAVPGSPAQGDMYILTAAPNAQTIAVRDNGAWVYITPRSGWQMYDAANTVMVEFDGSVWRSGRGLFGEYDADGTAPQLELRKKGSPAGVNAASAAYSTMGAFLFTGWTGAAFKVGAQIIAQTQELWSATVNGTALVFQVIAPGTSALVDRLQLRADALVPAQTNQVVDLGGSTTRFRKIWGQNLNIFPGTTDGPSADGEVTFQLNTAGTGFIILARRGTTTRAVTLTLA